MGTRQAIPRILLSVVIVLAAIGCTNSELVDRVAQLESENQTLTNRVEELEASVARLNVAELSDPLATRLTALERTVGPLEDSVVSLEQSVESVEDADAFLLDEIEAVAACVNAYMDTIAQWSSLISSSFTYYYC